MDPGQTGVPARVLRSTGDVCAQPEARGPQALRTLLLGTAAAGLMLFSYGRSAYAQATPNSPACGDVMAPGTSTVTCTGDPEDGVLVDGYTYKYVRTLNVNDIDRDIAPGAGTDGIKFYNTNGNDITIVSDLKDGPNGEKIIEVEDARGIYASSRLFFDGEAGNVSITNIGDLTTSGGDADGIYALSEVRSFFSTTGNATSGAVTVMQTGDITVSEAGQSNDGFPYGIKARSRVTLLTGTGNTISTGPVTVTHRGNITITGDPNVEAIRAASVVRSVGVVTQVSTAAAVTVEHTYDIVSDGQGIVALSDAGRANSSATAGAVTVTQNGKITTASGIGIEAKANAVSSAGTAKAGAVTVTQTGDISTNGDSTGGIYAWSFAETTSGTATSGPVTVTQTGTITTSGRESHGIQARTDGGGNVTVVHEGKITVTGQGANGIGAALRDGGDAFVSTAGNSPGAVYSKYGNGIFISTGSGNASLEIGSVVTGGSGTAVDLTNVAGTNRVELQEGFGFNGIVDARNNGNTQPVGNNLVFGGDGTNNFDLSQISLDLTEDAGEVFFGFDTFGVESGTWSFSGATDADFTVSGGTLGGNGTFGGLNFTGGTLAPGDSIGAIT
ncbi:MAG: hypothetical protein AAGF48_08260, partial [Pseudomonadota bacterium]